MHATLYHDVANHELIAPRTLSIQIRGAATAAAAAECGSRFDLIRRFRELEALFQWPMGACLDSFYSRKSDYAARSQ